MTVVNNTEMWQFLFLLLGLLIFLLGFIFLYRKSRSFRFYIKYLGFNFVIMLSAIHWTWVGLFHPFDVDNFHRCSGILYNFLVRAYSIRVKIEGREIFDTLKKKNFIIVANHQSSLDVFTLLQATPRRTTFLAKKELLFAPLFGFAAWLFGIVFVNRSNAKSARNVMDKTVKLMRDEKINLWIFPEGTRSQTGTLLPFKKGAFHLAVQAQLPIVPIVIHDYSSIFNKKNKAFEHGIFRVKVLDPISTDGLTADDVAELTDHVRQVMLKVFHENDSSGSHQDSVTAGETKNE